MTLVRLLCAWVSLAGYALAQGSAQAAKTPAPVVSETLAVQVIVDRLGFSPGEIDGRSGQNLRRALVAFQAAHRLPTSGQTDAQTWKRLVELFAPAQPLITYTLTADDVTGSFVERIPADLVEQASLAHLGYTSPLEALAEKFHSSPALLESLNQGATFTTAGQQITVPNVEPMEIRAPEQTRKASPGASPNERSATTGPTATTGAPAAARVVVRNATSSLTVEDESGRVLFHAPVTSGSEHDPLPIGTWQVTHVQRRPAFHYNPDLFWDADPKDSKARIPAGPNNPVGLVWIDLTKEHYGIHGTPEPGRVGHTQSHGCIRLTNWDALRVASFVTKGTTVVFE